MAPTVLLTPIQGTPRWPLACVAATSTTDTTYDLQSLFAMPFLLVSKSCPLLLNFSFPSFCANILQGCDNSGCWCNKGNLDLRISWIERCASTDCTFDNMNTATDVSILSGIQVQYCVDHSHSPSGMSLPSSAQATTTESSVSETGTTTGAGISTTETGTGTNTRARPTSGPSATGTSNPTSTAAASTSSSSLSTGAKAGIGIGATFCALLAIAILLLLRRRKPSQPIYPPPTSTQNFNNQPPMAPTPYSGTGPYSPPPMQHPAPLHIPQGGAAFAGVGNGKGDVSPIEEKAPMVGIARKEVGAGKGGVSPESTPATGKVQPASPSSEVPGSVPPPRHEVGNEGEIVHTELPVNQYPGQGQGGYQESRQGQWGYQYPGQAQELPSGAQQQQQQGGQGYVPYPGGQQYGGTYELGTGR
ncbi:hypothetical protein K458DRAFT_125212 [Lentithecium fluviatile CBS 122367]|uniref:Extracellular membrane protein CFEM domain-containing protein n=1 Tax=Lentithecium fluviatile CBS 122367 TaxID=1168545 RepID=A0A6G1JGF3_9PLEO|nr:hypothetical protein K458DRAFT_125212 [Lentithecium fluviatile CBS 122367]